jgi:2-polyprenyl-3-methyl-5-hydroxy-6-metoxy-1,4-benzoquinol methylase
MPDFTQRSGELEIMDDLNCTGRVLDQTLRELEIINKWLGGNQITIHAISELLKFWDKTKEITIVDLGCGGGDMLRIIDGWAKKQKLKSKLIGLDANPYIVAFAKKNLAEYPHIEFRTMNIFHEDFKNEKFDIVLGTLFYHHFTSEQLAEFFHQLKNNVKVGFIINDIHRHWLAYYSIKFLTQFFSRSEMVQYDAPLSVLRAFKKRELIKILKTANVQKFSIRWRWAFRWQVIVDVLKGSPR